jgi:hypothetical protein
LTISCFKKQGVCESLKANFGENDIGIIDFPFEKDRASQEGTFHFTIQSFGRMKVVPLASACSGEVCWSNPHP